MPVRLAVILIEKFADWEHGFMTSALRDFFGGEVRFYTPGGAIVTSEGGMRAAADGAIEALSPDDFDALAVIGSGVWMGEGAPDISPLVQKADAAGRLIGFICGGTVAAARAGVLNDRAHTSNDADTPKKAAAYTGTARYRDVPQAVRDGNLITAPGFAPRSFAYKMVAALVPDQEKYLGYFRQELTAEKFS